MTEIMDELKKAIVDGEDELAIVKTGKIIESGTDPNKIISDSILPGLQQAGELWKNNKYFLPDVVLSARAFKAAMKKVEPLLKKSNSKNIVGRFAIGVVHGDMHDLGKGLVIAMLTSAGFEIMDLGVDVPAEKFVQAIKDFRPDIIGMGAYMTPTMIQMAQIIKDIEKEGLRKKVKVMVGGVPTSQEFATEIGADAWGKDALETMNKALAIIGGKNGYSNDRINTRIVIR